MRNFLDGHHKFVALAQACLPPVSDFEHRLAVEQQATYIANARTMGTVNFLNSTTVLAAMLFLSNSFLIIPWYLIVNCFTILAFVLANKYVGRRKPDRSKAHLLFLSEKSLSILGILWGLPAVLFVPIGYDALIFFSLISTGMSAGFSAMMSVAPRIVSRFLFFSMLPVIASLLFFAGPIGLALSFLGIAYSAAMMRGSMMSFKQLREVVSMTQDARTARRDLSDAIEALDDAFAIFDAEGEIAMSNRRFRDWFPAGATLDQFEDGRVQQVGPGRWVMGSLVPASQGRSVSIHTDITVLKERERELIAAHRDAEEANAAKGRFMATMSHELRTPLNIINGFSSLMLPDSRIALSKDDVSEYALAIHVAGEHLLLVINDIIEFSKVGVDRYLHNPVDVDIRELLAQAVSLAAGFQRLGSTDGIEVSVSPQVGALVIDEMAFRRVLISLITNAIKFGGKKVNIAIRAFLQPDGAPVITVRDFGCGIARNELERVFEPFYQCERDRGGEFSGTGLGLSLSREIARLHGGDVLLSSQQGVGTTASIILPERAHIAPAEYAALCKEEAA